MRILLITPPLTQLNTPYPATAYLKGYYIAHGHDVRQIDLGIELADRVLSKEFLESIGLEKHARLIEPVKRFLRGKDDTLAPRIANRSLLPEEPPVGTQAPRLREINGTQAPRLREATSSRFAQLAEDNLEWSFGVSGTTDKAMHLATLFIEDIADYIRENVDPHFDLVRYAEYLSNDAPTFDPLYEELQQEPSPIDLLMLKILEEKISNWYAGASPTQPSAAPANSELQTPNSEHKTIDRVCITVPFPGCLYGALRCGQWLKAHTNAVIELGGGFPNTEWRQLTDNRIYEFCHEIAIDGCPDGDQYCPDFSDLPLDKYLSLSEMTNPMHRLWSQGRWNKMVMAHGCYWHRCAFCDTSLDYIGRFKAPQASTVVDHMERVMQQTGRTGFHFVDEALPPKLLREVAEEILHRGLAVSFWGNIRFEKAYTAELCDQLAEAGMIAVSGGLEVASDRLLKLMDKGVTIQQTIEACRHLRDAGIMVHTYLMYGFPTETLQESVDALETVRRMFDEGIVQSAFWHRYAMTCHSPSGLNPEAYGARRTSLQPNPFCNNEVDWKDPTKSQFSNFNFQFDYDIDAVGAGLRLATYNYMNGLGLDQPVRSWFPIRVPNPSLQQKQKAVRYH